MIKVATVLIFILLGFACIFGIIPFQGYESAPLFNNLTAQGWLPNGLIPLFTTLLIVNFAFNGTEMIGIAAGENENPKKCTQSHSCRGLAPHYFLCWYYHCHQFAT